VGQIALESRKILLIRRDNIGDLVCTTPLFRALREKLPQAFIAAYVNSYNLPVLAGNPDLNEVYAYTKGKHRAPGSAVAAHYWRRAQQLLILRRERFDDVIIAEPGYSPRLIQLARCFGPGRIVGFASENGRARGLKVAVARHTDHPLHECEDVFRLLEVYGIAGAPPGVRVFAAPATDERRHLRIGLHVSARKPSQRWLESRFVDLARALHKITAATLALFWSPGDERNPLHPGDDAKARTILEGLRDVPIEPFPTLELRSLIDGLAQCDYLICSDGGAMHLAAGLGKPIVCLFGRSDATRWHPWGVPYELLQTPSKDVTDIAVVDVVQAFQRLTERVPCKMSG
jgi:heptosyltransferase III